MILWINGAFGAGKTTVAELTAKKIEGSYIYDPETAGFFLWEALPEEIRMPENFQHLPLWREMNYRILKYMDTHYCGTIIVPMTIYNRVYYNEIIGRLREDGADVRHFILTAGKDYSAPWRKFQGVFLCVCRKAGQLRSHKERISIIM